MRLDNNIIERIAGLNNVPNLESLDLSFNNIVVIQGLDKLPKLKDLSLFQNRIVKLDGLKDLAASSPLLETLSVGNNMITDIHQLECLSGFSNIKIFNGSGNKCCEDDAYGGTVISSLHESLQFFDWKRINNVELDQVKSEYQKQIQARLAKREAAQTQLISEEIRSQEEIMWQSLYIDRRSLANVGDEQQQSLKKLALEHHQKRSYELAQVKECIDSGRAECVRKCRVRAAAYSEAPVAEALKETVKHFMTTETAVNESIEECLEKFYVNYEQLCTDTLTAMEAEFVKLNAEEAFKVFADTIAKEVQDMKKSLNTAEFDLHRQHVIEIRNFKMFHAKALAQAE